MARVVVIGAGVGGLAVAARLARARHQVTVCEQAAQVGGKLGRYTRDGFGFDTGPSLLTLPAVFRDLFLKTGPPMPEVLDAVPVDPVCHYRFADGLELDMPNASRPRIAAVWDGALGPGAGAAWMSLMQRASAIWDLTRGPFLESPLDGVRSLARLARSAGDVRTVAPWSTLRGIGRQYLPHPHQRTVLERYATYTGSDPRRAPAALVTVPFVEQTFGAWYLPGGLHQLGEQLLARAERCGATVRTGALVQRILLDGARVGGVELAGGERLPAEVVVAAGDARRLYADLLPPGAARREPARLERATPSLSGVVLLLALRGRTPGLRHHSVLFPADYDAEFDAVFGVGRHRGRPQPVPEPTLYISAPDDPACRPDEQHEAWFVLVNAPRHDPGRGVDWDVPGLAERYADDLLALLARRGFDVRPRLLWREVRTPADLERDTLSAGGSIYGSSSNGTRAAFLRPANASGISGLYLVGGSAHPGGGLPLVGLSAAIVAELIGRA